MWNIYRYLQNNMNFLDNSENVSFMSACSQKQRKSFKVQKKKETTVCTHLY